MKSIEEIAEDIRMHINTDNDAKRLIVEHILPLLGAEFRSVEELVNAPSYTGYLEGNVLSAQKEVRNAIDTLGEIVTDLDEACEGGGNSCSQRLENVMSALKNTVKSYLTLNI